MQSSLERLEGPKVGLEAQGDVDIQGDVEIQDGGKVQAGVVPHGIDPSDGSTEPLLAEGRPVPPIAAAGAELLDIGAAAGGTEVLVGLRFSVLKVLGEAAAAAAAGIDVGFQVHLFQVPLLSSAKGWKLKILSQSSSPQTSLEVLWEMS